MKYTREQLRDMAQQCLAARDGSDPRYLQLVMTLAVARGISPGQVQAAIELIAGHE